jgi:ATP-binding cassette subfamily B protein
MSIARTLLVDPKILVLDDSTSSVDLETEYLIQHAMSALLRGRTAFVIAQRMSTVRHADLILVIDGGRIVQQGTHEELLGRPGLYHEFYELQLQDREDESISRVVEKGGTGA